MTTFVELAHPEHSIFTSGCHWIVNPINCVGVMGGGLARDFKIKFPEMNAEYEALCEDHEIVPGQMWIWKDYVVNFPTKNHYKYPSKLKYIIDGMLDLANQIIKHNVESIAIPKLGCGLGGLEWEEVKPFIIGALSDLNIKVELYV